MQKSILYISALLLALSACVTPKIHNTLVAEHESAKSALTSAEKKALSALAEVGLEDKKTDWPDNLSGGQKQRVAMARALITTPRVILADEPTGALDSVTSNEVMDVLREVNSSGITVIIVTHEADIAARCDRTIRLKDGRIIEDGNSSEVVEPTAHGISPIS